MILFTVPSAFAEIHEVTIKPDNNKNGYEGSFVFSSGMRSCYGEVSAAFGGGKLTPVLYHYRNKTYTPADLGLTEFKKVSSSATIEADLYHLEQNLGHLKIQDVVFFSAAGCFTETFKVIEMVGLKNEDYRKKVKELSFRNVSASANVADYKIEGMIDQLEAKAKEAAKAAEAAKIAAQATPTPIISPVKNADVKSNEASALPAVTEKASSKSSGLSASKAPSSPPVSSSSSSKVDHSSADSKAKYLEKQEERKQKMAKEAVESIQAQKALDEQKVKAVTQAAGSFAEGAIAEGNGVGFSYVFTDAKDPGSPFSNELIGMSIGKTRKPTDFPYSDDWTSGSEFMLALSFDLLDSSPSHSTSAKSFKSTKSYGLLSDIKVFGNIKALGNLQPYFAFGGVLYQEYDNHLDYIGSKIVMTTGVGIAFVGNNGVLRFGYNLGINAFDFGFLF